MNFETSNYLPEWKHFAVKLLKKSFIDEVNLSWGVIEMNSPFKCKPSIIQSIRAHKMEPIQPRWLPRIRVFQDIFEHFIVEEFHIFSLIFIYI